MTDIIGPRQDLIDRNNAIAQFYKGVRTRKEIYESLGMEMPKDVVMLRRTDEGSTHWLGDDGYPACWRDHRECAEARVERLEAALRAALDHLDEWSPWIGDWGDIDEARAIIRDCLTNHGK